MTYYKRAVECYKNGLPSYLSDRHNSVLRVVPHDQFKKLLLHEVQSLLAVHHIVVTGVPTEPLSFNKDGLEALQGLDATAEIQG